MSLEGEAIRRARKKAGMSQEVLASKVGICQPNISLVERGGKVLTAEQLKRFAKALGVRIEELQGGKGLPRFRVTRRGNGAPLIEDRAELVVDSLRRKRLTKEELIELLNVSLESKSGTVELDEAILTSLVSEVLWRRPGLTSRQETEAAESSPPPAGDRSR